MKIRNLAFAFCLLVSVSVQAQIGDHRNDLSIGLNGGYIMSSIGFTPKVTQSQHGGITGGLSVRYVCEKYFNTICSIYGELNYAQVGWKERIIDAEDKAVINKVTGIAEKYSRSMSYVQIPIMAHLAWGREKKGFQFFVQAGPQFGIFLSESTDMNFDFAQRNISSRSSQVAAQDTMSVEKNFDYGIAAGAGMEYSVPHVGHFLLEGRYYYGLGNIYGSSKRDFFSKSNIGNIVIKLSYLFDISHTNKSQ